MGWMTPQVMQRRPGTPGVIFILADVTSSISQKNRSRICGEAMTILGRMPHARLLAFGERVVDITRDPSQMTQHTLWDCFDYQKWSQVGADWKRRNGTEGTFIGKALAVAAQSNPEATIVLSDGGTADKNEMFRIADGMTGVIHAYYCEPRRDEYQLETYFASEEEMWRYYSKGADKGAMQELARRGGGAFEVYPSQKGIYIDYGLREFPRMDNRRRFGGGNINIQGPGRKSIKLEEHVDVYHERVFHHHRLEDRVEGDPTPHDSNLDFAPSQINYQEGAHEEIVYAPRRTIPAFLNWLAKGSQPQQRALPSPQSQYRGELRPAGQVAQQRQSAPALPAPAQTLEEAFSQGQIAAQAGARQENCPYPPSDGRRNAWVAGLSRAKGLPSPSGSGMPLMIDDRKKVR